MTTRKIYEKIELMLRPEEIILNKIAQDKITLKEGLEWFDNLTTEIQREILLLTRTCLEQSITDKTNGDKEIIEKGIELIPLKPSMTPIILLRTKPLKTALDKILLLPDNEIQKSFISLVILFKYSDTKRRNTICKDGCNHEWHNLEI